MLLKINLSLALTAAFSCALLPALTAQVAINTDQAGPDSSAMLDISATDKGVLISRMTLGERDEIESPATGLMVFVTTDATFYYYDGAAWQPLTPASPSPWADGADDGIYFSAGNVGIGTDDPDQTLSVNGSLSASELDIFGAVPGTNALSLRAGTDTDKWINFQGGGNPLGRAGSIFSEFGNSHYFVYNQAGNLRIAYSSQSAEDPDVDNAAALLVLGSSGNLGLGTPDPQEKLHVTGSIRMDDGNQAEGLVMTSDANGVGSWQPLAVADGSPSNELQTLSRSGDNITLSQGGGTVSVNDDDSSATNELQAISRSGLNIIMSHSGGTVSVADDDNNSTNEIQQLSRNGPYLQLSNGGGEVDLSLEIYREHSYDAQPVVDAGSSATPDWVYFDDISPGPIPVAAGSVILAFVTFRYKVSGGSGNDDVAFNVQAYDGATTVNGGSTGRIEIYDDHRGKYSLVSLHRALPVTQAGNYKLRLGMYTGYSDDEMYVSDINISAFKLIEYP